MKAFEILSQWPAWVHAEASAVFGSPAWRVPMRVSGMQTVLLKSERVPVETIALRISLGDDDFVLGVSDTLLFPELHALWSCRREVPQTLLLALIEKECGVLFEVLENVFRRSLSLKAILEQTASGASSIVPQSFELHCKRPDGKEAGSLMFTLPITPGLLPELGYLKYLDPEHASLREMTLPIEVQLAHFSLTEEEVSGLAPGDRLMLPEIDESGRLTELVMIIGKTFMISHNTLGMWREDGLCRVMSTEELSISFGDFCDGHGPSPGEISTVTVVSAGRVCATGRIGMLCGQRCVEIEEIR